MAIANDTGGEPKRGQRQGEAPEGGSASGKAPAGLSDFRVARGRPVLSLCGGRHEDEAVDRLLVSFFTIFLSPVQSEVQ